MSQENPPRRILIVAAEASSALYAQRLLELWRERGEKIEAFGIGSRQMEALGFRIVGRSEELAVVGIQEVLAHWGLIKQTFYQLIDEAKTLQPDVVLLMDYPDFNFRLAKKLKPLGLPVVYYISPQIWAWRRGRVKIMKKWVSKVFVLFPFEKRFYEEHQVPCDFVGHPLLDELHEDLLNPQTIRSRREKYGLNTEQPVVALLPGSRRSELKHHLATQLQVADRLYQTNPTRQFILIVAPTFSKEEMQSLLPPLHFPLQLIQGDSFEMIGLADVVLTASGTATLIVGLMEKPMVIMYKMNALTAFLAKRIVTHAPFFGMINLILNEKVVPELFQEQASVENLTQEMERFLDDPSLRESTILRLKKAKAALGDRGATRRVHEALQEFWKHK